VSQVKTVELEGCKKIQVISLLWRARKHKKLGLTGLWRKILVITIASNAVFLKNISFVGDTVIERWYVGSLLEYPS